MTEQVSETVPSMAMKVEKKQSSRYFEPGFYEHYKGGIYYAALVAHQNEMTPDRLAVVVYFSLDKSQWNTRPMEEDNYDSFLDDVLIDGDWRPRFKKMDGGDLLMKGVLEKYLATSQMFAKNG